MMQDIDDARGTVQKTQYFIELLSVVSATEIAITYMPPKLRYRAEWQIKGGSINASAGTLHEATKLFEQAVRKEKTMDEGIQDIDTYRPEQADDKDIFDKLVDGLYETAALIRSKEQLEAERDALREELALVRSDNEKMLIVLNALAVLGARQ